MSSNQRIQQAYERATVMPYDNESKIVIISDCHRGTGSGADNFSKNQNLYYVALTHYHRHGYSYIELGDGDELWENRSFAEIAQEYDHVFGILSEMHREKRFHMIYGNHDMVKRDPKWVKRNLSTYQGGHQCNCLNLFPGIQIHESIILRHRHTGRDVFLLHGHQADFFNDRLWFVAKFLVRHVWKPLELVGIQNPTHTPTNPKRRWKVEQHMVDWSSKHNRMLIAGHTHRPNFPEVGETLYFNDGSCVHRRFITALEIEGGAISMVKWSVQPKPNGVLFVSREVLEGPVNVESYFAKTPEMC